MKAPFVAEGLLVLDADRGVVGAGQTPAIATLIAKSLTATDGWGELEFTALEDMKEGSKRLFGEPGGNG